MLEADVFQVDPDFVQHEEEYQQIKKELLGDEEEREETGAEHAPTVVDTETAGAADEMESESAQGMSVVEGIQSRPLIDIQCFFLRV